VETMTALRIDAFPSIRLPHYGRVRPGIEDRARLGSGA
jgi:hypothetical protein